MLTIQSKTRKAGKLVSTSYADNLIRNYKQERWAANSRKLGKEDSLSVWYSVEELEAFLQKAKEHGGDGVRLYFGAYDKDFQDQPLYAGRQTIVMVATQGKESEKGIIDKEIYIQGEKGTSILAYNFGRMCPPFCTPKLDEFDEPGIGITIVDKGEEGMTVV